MTNSISELGGSSASPDLAAVRTVNHGQSLAGGDACEDSTVARAAATSP